LRITQIDIFEVDNSRFLLPSSLLCCLITLLASCSSSKNITIQNTTARFNILFNAQNLLHEHMLNDQVYLADDFTGLLPIYPAIDDNSSYTILDSVIKKANVIIKEKSESKYIDDAYSLIADASFLKGNFYEAAELYRYIYTTYPSEIDLAQHARIQKARVLLLLNDLKGAAGIIDSAAKFLDQTKSTLPDLYATKAQLLIAQSRFNEAEDTLGLAIAAKPDKNKKRRWTFVLAQLQEINNKKDLAWKNYRILRTKFVPTELGLYADLNQARLNNELKGNPLNQLAILHSFLNQDVYAAYRDRIFYLVGKLQEQNGSFDDALKSYRNAVALGSSTGYQRGLAYTALAEGYLQAGYYTGAKTYMDSALVSLPDNSPRRIRLEKTAENLEHLTGLFAKLKFEENLQRIAGLPESERYDAITEALRKNETSEAEYPTLDLGSNKDINAEPLDAFYFNNKKALSQGALDFQVKWGNKVLKDDWRYENSGTSAADVQLQSQAPTLIKNTNQILRKEPQQRFEDYLNNIPLTANAREVSDNRLSAILYQIGLVYLNSIQDEHLARSAFERIVSQLPKSEYALQAYYRLYLITRTSDNQKSKEYEAIILENYPGSEIANTIAAAANDIKLTATPEETYIHIYNLFADKQYQEVENQIRRDQNLDRNGIFAVQLDYLYTLAMGYSQSPAAFEQSLLSFVSRHAQDSLITPIVKQHLNYITLNRVDFSRRKFALVNNEIDNPDENIAERSMMDAAPRLPEKVLAATEGSNAQTTSSGSLPSSVSQSTHEEAKDHYFVINVFSTAINLAPSRFGLGQFNRSMYAQAGIKHQLKVVNKENQLIFVGPFHSEEEAIQYEKRILPMIKQIMKVPTERYNTFVISAERLEQLNTRVLIDSYVEHTKKIK